MIPADREKGQHSTQLDWSAGRARRWCGIPAGGRQCRRLSTSSCTRRSGCGPCSPWSCGSAGRPASRAPCIRCGWLALPLVGLGRHHRRRRAVGDAGLHRGGLAGRPAARLAGRPCDRPPAEVRWQDGRVWIAGGWFVLGFARVDLRRALCAGRDLRRLPQLRASRVDRRGRPGRRHDRGHRPGLAGGPAGAPPMGRRDAARRGGAAAAGGRGVRRDDRLRCAGAGAAAGGGRFDARDRKVGLLAGAAGAARGRARRRAAHLSPLSRPPHRRSRRRAGARLDGRQHLDAQVGAGAAGGRRHRLCRSACAATAAAAR